MTRKLTRHHPRRAVVTLLAGMVAALSLLTGCGGPGATITAPSAEHTADGTTTAPRLAALPPAVPTRLRIPAINVDSRKFVELGLEQDRTMEVPGQPDQVGWYGKGPMPGERGPSVLAAHVDWKSEKGVFYELRRLRAGHTVLVDRADGMSALFTVTRVERYPKERFPTDKVYGDVDRPELRLITCGGAFDRSERSYEDNVVVYARMVTRSGAGPAATESS